jgi:predicted transcriptional regulator
LTFTFAKAFNEGVATSINFTRRATGYMKLDEVVKIVHGVVLNPQTSLKRDVKGACGADLMSDVLASIQPDALLLTGLTNLQVVRTAQMADVRAIVLVRGKNAQPEMLELATQENIPIISSSFGMFELCGRLHRAGLPSFESQMPTD